MCLIAHQSNKTLTGIQTQAVNPLGPIEVEDPRTSKPGRWPSRSWVRRPGACVPWSRLEPKLEALSSPVEERAATGAAARPTGLGVFSPTI